jgi:hypothetical protein
LNVATVGGYGLGKDMTNIVDQTSTPEEILTSSVGLVLAVAPVMSASNFAKSSGKNASDLAENLIKTSSKTISEIGEATAKKASLKTIYKKTTEEAVQNTQTFINALKDNTVTAGSVAFKQASANLDKSITKKALAQALYNQSKKEVREAIVKNTAMAPVKTLGATLKAGGNVVKDMFKGAGSGYSDMVNNSLKDIIKRDGKLVYWGGSILDNTYNSIFSNELNKYVANELKEGTGATVATKPPTTPNIPPINTNTFVTPPANTNTTVIPPQNQTSTTTANTTTANTTTTTNTSQFTGKPAGYTYKQNPNVTVTETRYLNGKMTYTNDPKILNEQKIDQKDIGKNLGLKMQPL